MKRIKIIRCQSRICVGGPAYHTIFLSSGLDNDRFETILVGGKNNPDEKSMLPFADELGVKYKIIKQMGREISFLDDLVSLFKLFRFMKKEKPEIVHTHTAKAGTIGRLAAWLAGVPKIYHTFHGHIFASYFGKLKSKFFIFLERQLAKISTGIVVISESQKHDIVERYKIASESKVNLIPLGFEWDRFFNTSHLLDLRNHYNIPQNKFLIGIVGRIVPIKDHLLFIEIAGQLLEIDGNKFHFVIIGDGELRPEVEEKIKEYKIQDHFTFTGWLELDSSIYNSLDLLLLTSKNEGTPVAIIESLGAGTPVIAASVGGVPDIMKMYNTKHLVENRDPEAFVKLVLKLVNKSQKVSPIVRKRIIHFFSSERLVNDIKSLYLKYIKM